MFDNIIHGIYLALQPKLFLITVISVLGGYLIGALPGLTATMGVAILVPLTFNLPPQEGLIILIAVFISAVQGGSIPAILINTPGTPAAAATIFDGYPLAQKGLAGKAIGMAQIASFFGLIISWLFLITIAPILANIALTFSTPEYFVIAVFGLSIIASLSADSPLKGIISGFLGLFFATIGLDPMDGVPRLTFGIENLLGGVSYVPALIGLFGISEIFFSVEAAGFNSKVNQKLKDIFPTMKEIKKCLATFIRSSLIGTFIGIIPGTGADIAAFVSYGEAKRWSKNSDKFGTGLLEGVAAPEAANNAVCGGAMIPLLTLGIPGDAVTAIILGAFIIRGLRPGASLFTEQGSIAYTLFGGFLIASIITLIIGLSLVKILAHTLNIQKRYLLPAIFSFCLVGSYAIQSSIFDVYISIFFGILGYFMRKFGFPVSPVVLALILGPMAEYNFRLSLMASQGDYSIFITRPICLGFLILSIFSVVYHFCRKHRAEREN